MIFSNLNTSCLVVHLTIKVIIHLNLFASYHHGSCIDNSMDFSRGGKVPPWVRPQ